MLPSAIVGEINQYGFDNVNYADARIYAILTRANRRLCAIAPFPFTEKFSTWTETQNVANIATPLVGAPADIRAVRNFGCPALADNSGNVSYLRKDILEKTYGFNSYLLNDFPRHYYVYGKNATGGCNLYIYPYILANTLFALDYHARPPVLSAASTEAQMLLPDEYCDIIQTMALAELSRSDGDLDDGAGYEALYKSRIADMLNDFDANVDSPDPMIYTDSEDSWFG